MAQKLSEWQGYYSAQRVHGALRCKTPQARFEELKSQVPAAEQVAARYLPEQEPDRCIDYELDPRFLALIRLKRYQ